MVTHGFAVHSSIAIQFSIRIFHINRTRTGRQSGGSSQPSVVHAHIFNPHTADGPAIPRLQTWEETWTAMDHPWWLRQVYPSEKYEGKSVGIRKSQM